MRRGVVWWIAFASIWTLTASPASAAAGDLDPTFSDDGRVVTDFGFGRMERGEGVVVGPDGRIVVAGWTTAGVDGIDSDFGLVKYDTHGALDTSFGGDGLVTTDFPVPAGAPDSSDSGLDVAIHGGRIAVVGQSGFGDAFAVAVYRYEDGALDTTFSGDGIAEVEVPELVQIAGIAFQPDGKMVLLGTFRDEFGIDGFAVLRLRPGGRRDLTFDEDGLVTTDVWPSDEAGDIALQADGRIVAVGSVSTPTPESGIAVVRYTNSGSLDPSFAGDGVRVTFVPEGGAGNGVAIAPDGKIVVTGYAILNGTQDLIVYRYRRGGRLDRETTTSPGFSGDGKVRVNFGDRDRGEAVAVQADGKPVAVGNSGGNWAIARFLSTGERDTTFSLDGKLTHSMGVATLDIAMGVAIAPDGSIVAGGFGGPDFAAARYLP